MNASLQKPSVGQIAYAVVLLALGAAALMHKTFPAAWTPAYDHVPLSRALATAAALVALICGVGLLIPSVATFAARVLFAWSMLWFAVLRLPALLHPRDVGAWYEVSEMAVMVAGAWVLYVRLAAAWDRQHIGFLSGPGAFRAARVLYGLPLVLFGVGHFIYLDATAQLVPAYLPWHKGWAVFTACTFFAAALGIVCDVFAWTAATLSAGQIGFFVLLVYVPMLLHHTATDFQVNETIVSTALTASALVVAESYRRTTQRTAGKSR